MQGDAKVIEHLNRILRNELTAINQYFLHARMLDNWGVTILGKHEYKESIEEMRHADMLIQRILFLEGHPNLQDLDALRIGQTVPEVLTSDLRLEQKGLPDLREAIVHCEKVLDYATRDLFITILANEEEHVDWLETQLGLINRIGLENYIQLQSDPSAESKYPAGLPRKG